ncbi:MAG TPA: ABC transporter ATP-binding protein, partial [Gammaproteobacteria bacterium]|nr:ABC transporter ATP-binding protein [Gammaproteobacteria bacterium]
MTAAPERLPARAQARRRHRRRNAELPSGDAREAAQSRVPLRRVAELFLPYRVWVGGLVLVAVLQAAANVVSPFLVRLIVDDALPKRSAGLVATYAGGMIAASAVAAMLGMASTYLSNRIGQEVMHDLRVRVYEHLHRMSLRFFTRTRSGELQSRIANDIGGVDGVVTNTASVVVQNTLTAAAVGAAAFVMDWRLASICLIVVPVFLVLSLRLGRQRRALAGSRQRRVAELAGLVEESLSVAGVLLTKTLGREQQVAGRFMAESRALSRVEMARAMSGRWMVSSRRASLTMIPAIVYLIAGVHVAHGGSLLTIGTAVAFASMLNRLVVPATALQGIGVQLSASLALFARIFEVLDLPLDMPEPASGTRPASVRGDVELDRV